MYVFTSGLCIPIVCCYFVNCYCQLLLAFCQLIDYLVSGCDVKLVIMVQVIPSLDIINYIYILSINPVCITDYSGPISNNMPYQARGH